MLRLQKIIDEAKKLEGFTVTSGGGTGGKPLEWVSIQMTDSERHQIYVSETFEYGFSAYTHWDRDHVPKTYGRAKDRGSYRIRVSFPSMDQGAYGLKDKKVHVSTTKKAMEWIQKGVVLTRQRMAMDDYEREREDQGAQIRDLVEATVGKVAGLQVRADEANLRITVIRAEGESVGDFAARIAQTMQGV